MPRRSFPLLLAHASVLAGSPITSAQPPAQPPAAPTADARQKLAADMDAYLWTHVLAPRFPRCVDEKHGGFHTNYARDWSPLQDRLRFIVYEARVTWTAATVARLRPEARDEYLRYVRHGVRYLADVMWDREHGGFHTFVDLAGRAAQGDAFQSRPVYGQAFAVYGLAAAHVLGVAACASAVEPVDQAKTHATLPADVPMILTLESVTAAVLEDAAQRTGVGKADLSVESAVAVTWPDGSLGCPQPGMNYPMALVPGYRIRVRAGARALDYHASQRGYFVLCPDGMAVEPVGDDVR